MNTKRPSNAINMIGQKFGRLTVISRGPNQKRNQATWNCICDCGNTPSLPIRGSQLRNGRTKSCGCARIDGAMKTAQQRLSKDPRLTSARHVYSNEYNDGDLTFDSFLKLTQQPCYYCGTTRLTSMYNRYITRHKRAKNRCMLINLADGNFYYNGLDRVDNTKPHNIDNLVTCCKWCNYAKRDRTIEDFKSWVKQLHNHLFDQNEKAPSSSLGALSELVLVS